MKLFLDTIDLKELEYWRDLNLIDGVTTNPTTLSKISKAQRLEHLKNILSLMSPYDVSIQLTSTEFSDQLKEAEEYNSLGDNVVIKVPGLIENLALTKKLLNFKLKVNVTLVFTPMQAAIYAKLGVQYVSQFIGRLYDHNVNGLEILQNTVNLVKEVGGQTQVLAASIRNSEQLVHSYLVGADVVTVSPEVLKSSLEHPLIKSGFEKFLKDSQN